MTDIIFTVCNRNTLAPALALAGSVQEYHPELPFYLGWADSGSPQGLPANIKLITTSHVDKLVVGKMQERYYDFEVPHALRPWFALEIISENPGSGRLIFLAPTVILFDKMDQITAGTADVLLTPNLRQPLPPARLLDDKRILNIGMFHAGSWIMKCTEETDKALRWWASRTADRASYDLCNGMNMDQLWLNYMQIWVPETKVILDPGWHFGLHSVLSKTLESTDGKYLVNGNPLISIDFAGLDAFDPIWSDYRELLSENAHFRKLFAGYQQKLATFKSAGANLNHAILGKASKISGNRIFRNRLAARLRSVTNFIDEF